MHALYGIPILTFVNSSDLTHYGVGTHLDFQSEDAKNKSKLKLCLLGSP